MNQITKLNQLIDKLELQLNSPNSMNEELLTSTSTARTENLRKLFSLYKELELFKKHDDFSTIFDYKAMNLMGIVLKDEEFAQIHEGKYVQIICITYKLNEKGKNIAQNSSLGYFGKAEKLSLELKNNIIEFVLRWRYEKAFRHTEQYEHLLSKLL
ncbi:MAG: hypothetical protein K0U38_11610 [Epsilonproteobacteria bacterium]|nr:hypothetical protein [Campylobacterota bacterium]